MTGIRFGGVGLGLRLLALGWALTAKPSFPWEGSFGDPGSVDPSMKRWVYACAQKDCREGIECDLSLSPAVVPCSCGPQPKLYNRLDADTLTFAPLTGATDEIWVCVKCKEPPYRAGGTPELRSQVHGFAEFRQFALKSGG